MRFKFSQACPSPQPPAKPTPRELFEQAAADKNYSMKACLRSLASRSIFLTGDKVGVDHAGRLHGFHSTRGRTTLVERVKAWIPPPWKGLRETRKTENDLSTSSATDTATDAPSYAVAAITRAEPGVWGGRKAHLIRVHVEFHPDSKYYLQRAEVHIRLWKAGDAIKSFEQHSHLDLSASAPPDAPQLGTEAPPIVLYAPRAAVGRPADSVTEPYWTGHFKSGDHFIYFAEAFPPRDLSGGPPRDSKQPRSLLNIAVFGDSKERCAPPHFDVVLVVLSDGKPFELTASTFSLHWGLPPVRSYLFTPYKPARFTYTTRLIPKKEKKIAIDFKSDGMREKLKEMVPWAKAFDTVSPGESLAKSGCRETHRQIWFGCPLGCVDKPLSHGRNCSSNFCVTCTESRRICKERRRAERAASLRAGIMTSNPE